MVPNLIENGMGGGAHNFLEGIQPRTIPDKFGLIWFSKFIGEELNVIFYIKICPI
jgi:hypothetical protein